MTWFPCGWEAGGHGLLFPHLLDVGLARTVRPFQIWRLGGIPNPSSSSAFSSSSYPLPMRVTSKPLSHLKSITHLKSFPNRHRPVFSEHSSSWDEELGHSLLENQLRLYAFAGWR